MFVLNAACFQHCTKQINFSRILHQHRSTPLVRSERIAVEKTVFLKVRRAPRSEKLAEWVKRYGRKIVQNQRPQIQFQVPRIAMKNCIVFAMRYSFGFFGSCEFLFLLRGRQFYPDVYDVHKILPISDFGFRRACSVAIVQLHTKCEGVGEGGSGVGRS